MVPRPATPRASTGVTRRAATGTLRDASSAAALNNVVTRTSSTVPRRATRRITARSTSARKATLTGSEKLGVCHSDDVGEGLMMGDHGQRVGHQPQADRVDRAQGATGQGEARQPGEATERVVVDAPAHHAQHQVRQAQRPAAVHVEPHPHERHEHPRGALVGLDHDRHHREQHQRDEQGPRRPVPGAHGQEGARREDPSPQLTRRAGEHPPQPGQRRAQHGVHDLQSVPAGQVLETPVQDLGQPRLDHPGTAQGGEGVGVPGGDAMGQDVAARGDVGQERVVVEALEADDGGPDGEGAADDGRNPRRAHGPEGVVSRVRGMLGRSPGRRGRR